MKYLILGAGISARECLKALIKRKKKVSICLNQNEIYKIEEYSNSIEEIILFDDFYKIDFVKFDYIIRSPGISILNPCIKYLKDNNIKMINEMELAYLLSNKKGYYIGITGSNGKTTTVSLLYECIKKQTNNVLLAGNIGVPLVSLIDKINNYTIIILEMSSFQLEDMHELKLDIASILNLSCNHLDNVTSLDYYYTSKFNISNLQGANDYLIVNKQNEIINDYLNKLAIKSRIIDYSLMNVNISDLKLKGNHNIDNIKVVMEVLKILGFETDFNIIKNFCPLDYHLQELDLNRDYLVVNDSKSTTVESLKSAIETYNDKNIILIFGGKNKGGDFSFLNEVKLKKKICFGKLSEEIDDINVDSKVYNLEDAIIESLKEVNDNDVILFSCGCASFDLFSSYKERGECFNRLIKKL